jgi:hypothetical protein
MMDNVGPGDVFADERGIFAKIGILEPMDETTREINGQKDGDELEQKAEHHPGASFRTRLTPRLSA